MPDSSISDLRLLPSILCEPKLRRQLATALAGDSPEGVVSRLSFVGPDGFDQEGAIRLRQAFTDYLGPAGLFDRQPIELPTQAAARLDLSQRACQTAFDLAGWAQCTEAELNAALALLVDDVALARRDCVDSGFLIRDRQGTRYRLAERESDGQPD
ncbi:MAG: DUF2087 domain-containing protein [Actinomycetaceae bacterium]|nr:DUF2087 domain-containing protein [Actinomycetaceae bacterium]